MVTSMRIVGTPNSQARRRCATEILEASFLGLIFTLVDEREKHLACMSGGSEHGDGAGLGV